jgi:hypothetical protein
MYTNCVVDAALLMGRSFRVGCGPNGMLIHSGSLVNNPRTGLSSIIHIEKVASDKVVRDDKNKIKEDLEESSLIRWTSIRVLIMNFRRLNLTFSDIASESCGKSFGFARHLQVLY